MCVSASDRYQTPRLEAMVISCESILLVVTCCSHRMYSEIKYNFYTFRLILNLARIIQVVNYLSSPVPQFFVLQSKNDLAILLPSLHIIQHFSMA